MNPSDSPLQDADDGSQSNNLDMQDGTDPDGQHHPVAEFLYQLTKMLTDDNSEIIEWVDGRIKVRYPERLEAEVLHKYFRHSKFASFQRQLNYFGFRKIAGKGKMSPCSYVNDAATGDIRSLLLIKRKTNGSAARKAALQQRAVAMNLSSFPFSALAANPAAMAAAATLNPQALTSAMALLSDNALRNGLFQQMGSVEPSAQLGLLALQQQQLQQQQLQQQQQQQARQVSQQTASSQFGSETSLDHHRQALHHQQQLQQLQQRFQGLSNPHPGPTPQGSMSGSMSAPAPSDNKGNSGFQVPTSLSSASQATSTSGTPSLEQLQANLAATLTGQLGNFAYSLNPSNMASLGAASLALANATKSSKTISSENPATAALQSMPASNATDTATIFQSAINLESLLQEYQANETRQQLQQHQHQQQKNQLAGSFNNTASQVLMNRLPSSGTIFPSTASFGNMGMLGSSNRLSSLLSLSSLSSLTREASLADLAASLPGNSRMAAGLQSFSQTDTTQRFRN
jgi:hypothetical protein